MCNCLEKGMKSQNAKDKKACLSLQEKHAKALKDGSKVHEEYKKAVFACEAKLTAEKENSGSIPEGFENQKQAVCDCFANTKPPMKCFRIQAEFEKLQGDRRVEFVKATNACAP